MPPSPSLSAAAGSPSATDLVRALLRRNEAVLLLVLIVLLAFFSIATDNFLTTRNITNVLGQASLAMIGAIGLGMLVISGGSTCPIGSLDAPWPSRWWW